MQNNHFTPGWNDPPPCLQTAANPASSGCRLNRQRRPVDPSIQGTAIGFGDNSFKQQPHHWGGNVAQAAHLTTGPIGQQTYSQQPQQQFQQLYQQQSQVIQQNSGTVQFQASPAQPQHNQQQQHCVVPPALGTHPGSAFSPTNVVNTKLYAGTHETQISSAGQLVEPYIMGQSTEQYPYGSTMLTHQQQ